LSPDSSRLLTAVASALADGAWTGGDDGPVETDGDDRADDGDGDDRADDGDGDDRADDGDDDPEEEPDAATPCTVGGL
jgi:hypothetical protein